MAYWKAKGKATPIKFWGNFGASALGGITGMMEKRRNPIEEKINRVVERKVNEATQNEADDRFSEERTDL